MNLLNKDVFILKTSTVGHVVGISLDIRGTEVTSYLITSEDNIEGTWYFRSEFEVLGQKETKMSKYLSLEEFVTKGYLQEANRRFFHPIGLALEIAITDCKDGSELYTFSGIRDSREDEEGFIFDLEHSKNGRLLRFKNNAKFIDSEIAKRSCKRLNLFNSIVEPLKGPT